MTQARTTNHPAKNWVFTLNNPTEEEKDHVVGLINTGKFQYLIFGEELGENQTPHLQGYLQCINRIRLTGLKKIIPRAHFEVMRGTSAEAANYCKKDGKYYEFGDYVEVGSTGSGTKAKAGGRLGGDLEQQRWAKALESAREGKFDEVPPDILIRHYNNLVRIRDASRPEPESLTKLENYWNYGPTGTGKSLGVVQKYGEVNIYRKSTNKWWDGYNGQQVVLIEELSPDDTWIISFLKIWCDYAPFNAEIKGSAMKIRPPIIIVNSNYSLREFTSAKPQEFGPLRRRFKVVHYSDLFTRQYPTEQPEAYDEIVYSEDHLKQILSNSPIL